MFSFSSLFFYAFSNIIFFDDFPHKPCLQIDQFGPWLRFFWCFNFIIFLVYSFHVRNSIYFDYLLWHVVYTLTTFAIFFSFLFLVSCSFVGSMFICFPLSKPNLLLWFGLQTVYTSITLDHVWHLWYSSVFYWFRCTSYVLSFSKPTLLSWFCFEHSLHIDRSEHFFLNVFRCSSFWCASV